ncbi:unnamed protein product [Mesocestoides corti]|uniref:G_PROTEIN_RECEP_F1_2 domain-containing protein n=1 Tax=Mesocestoides corti TaxID=53468 RepID=A0A0R3UNC0_MESCO|nr:unnamed protein product [Mesocestoides corti]
MASWSLAGDESLSQLDEYLLQQILSQSLEAVEHRRRSVVDIAKNSVHIRVVICLIYAVIFVLGILGNSLVVYVILRKQEMRSITNLFLINLAISDILMTLLATPFTPAIVFLEEWSFHLVLCKLLPMVMAVTVYVSTLTSTAIAMERCIVTVYRFQPKLPNFTYFLGTVVTWVASAVFSCPLAIYQDISFNEKTNTSSCQENWPHPTTRAVFTVTSFVLQFIVPCIIITACYTRIGLVLRNRANRKIGIKSREKEELEMRRIRRAVKMLIAMVVIFVVCWIPLNCLWMVTDLGTNSQAVQSFAGSGYFTLVFFVCHSLAMSSAVYNPFLYTWLNESFRNEFYQVLPCLRSLRAHHNATTSCSSPKHRRRPQKEVLYIETLSHV